MNIRQYKIWNKLFLFGNAPMIAIFNRINEKYS